MNRSHDPYLTYRWIDKINPEQYDYIGRSKDNTQVANFTKPRSLVYRDIQTVASTKPRDGNLNDTYAAACVAKN